MPDEKNPKQTEPQENNQIQPQEVPTDDDFEQIDTRRRIDKGEDPIYETKEDQRKSR